MQTKAALALLPHELSSLTCLAGPLSDGAGWHLGQSRGAMELKPRPFSVLVNKVVINLRSMIFSAEASAQRAGGWGSASMRTRPGIG